VPLACATRSSSSRHVSRRGADDSRWAVGTVGWFFPVAPAIQRADQRVGVLLPWPFSGHANQRVESLPHTVNGGGAGPALSVRLMPPFVYIGSEQTEIVAAHRLHLFQQSRYWCCVLGWCLGLWMGDENMTPRKNRELLKMAFTNVLACVVSVTVLRALRASTVCGRWVL